MGGVLGAFVSMVLGLCVIGLGWSDAGSEVFLGHLVSCDSEALLSAMSPSGLNP